MKITVAELRAAAVKAAVIDEMTRFNIAIENGAIPVLTTFSGKYLVHEVDAAFWYTASNVDSSDPIMHSWAGRNNDKWADLLRQAGVSRNPLFA